MWRIAPVLINREVGIVMQLMKDGGNKQWSLYALVFIGTLAMIAFAGCEKTGGEGESVSTVALKAPPPPPPAYADKHMPEGWWSDPEIIEQGRQLFIGAENIDVNCAACHGKNGKPVKKSAWEKSTPVKFLHWRHPPNKRAFGR